MRSLLITLTIAIGYLLSLGLVTHAVIKAVSEKEFLELNLSILKNRNKVLEAQKEIQDLKSEIKDLKTLIFIQIEKKEVKK